MPTSNDFITPSGSEPTPAPASVYDSGQAEIVTLPTQLVSNTIAIDLIVGPIQKVTLGADPIASLIAPSVTGLSAVSRGVELSILNGTTGAMTFDFSGLPWKAIGFDKASPPALPASATALLYVRNKGIAQSDVEVSLVVETL